MKTGAIGITGPTSFIGRHLRRRVAELGGTPILFHGDICNPSEVVAFVRQCDTIIHLAGCNRGEAFGVYRVNAVGGANVVTAAAAVGNRHVIFPSTKYICRYPDSPYSRGKLAVEAMLRQLAGFAGCKASVFRMSNTYGPGALPHYVSVIATFCWFEANGRGPEMPILGDGSQVTDFTPIDTVIDHLLAACDHQDSFTFTQVEGEPLSVRQIAEIVRDPVARKSYPVIQATVEFFAEPSPLKELTGDACLGETSREAEIPQLLKRHGFRVMRQHDIKVEFNQVSFAQLMRSDEIQWLCLLSGGIVVDIYAFSGEYMQSRLLDEQHVRCIQLTPAYQYDLRNPGAEPAQALLMSEAFQTCDKAADTAR